MKRILSLLTVFVMVFALSVPAFASTDNVYDFGGYVVPLPTDVTSDTIDELLAHGFSMYLFKRSIGDAYFLYISQYALSAEIGAKSLVNNNDFTVSVNRIFYDSSEWVDTTFELLEGESADLVSSSLVWKSDGEFVYCDGSSCPAVDFDYDGICDDCGMTLMRLSRTPVAPDVTGSNKNFVMFYSGTVYKYTVYTSDESYTIRGEEYGARYRTYIDPSVNAQRYESYDGINWEQTYTGKTANDYPGEIGYELISSTFDWYTEAGDRFFPVPLWEEVQTVTQGEMMGLTSETAGTMMILTVCGVGCLTLLAVLKLFGKRSLIFRS